MRNRFVAIDFETADPKPDSACAVGLVRVEDGLIVKRIYRLIRPPRRDFVFTYIHGITWAQVQHEPTFEELWPELREFLVGAEFLAAHNARFDQGVFRACCLSAAIPAPRKSFICTVQLARKIWGIRPTNLPNVCRHLGIDLDHHQALSDAEACARIVLASQSTGPSYDPNASRTFFPKNRI